MSYLQLFLLLQHNAYRHDRNCNLIDLFISTLLSPHWMVSNSASMLITSTILNKSYTMVHCCKMLHIYRILQKQLSIQNNCAHKNYFMHIFLKLFTYMRVLVCNLASLHHDYKIGCIGKNFFASLHQNTELVWS